MFVITSIIRKNGKNVKRLFSLFGNKIVKKSNIGSEKVLTNFIFMIKYKGKSVIKEAVL